MPLRFLREIIIGLLIILLVMASYALVKSYKVNGEQAQLIKTQKDAIGIQVAQIGARDQKIRDLAKSDSDAYSRCQEAAATSDSSAFKKGVEVGKLLGAKQCVLSGVPSPASSSPAVLRPVR